MTRVLAAAAPIPDAAVVAVAKLKTVCHSATIRIEERAELWSQVSTTDPNNSPIDHPITPATVRSRKFWTTQNKGACHAAHTTQTSNDVAARP